MLKTGLTLDLKGSFKEIAVLPCISNGLSIAVLQ